MNKRTGDRVVIAGDYQYRALHEGSRIRRAWTGNRLRFALDIAGEIDKGTLLDMGCGSGLMADLVHKKYQLPVVGVDANDDAVSFAQKTFGTESVHFIKGYPEDLPALNQQYAAIFFLEVIEHITRGQGEQFFKTAFDLLDSGGKLILSTPNRKSLWPMLEWLLDRTGQQPNLSEGQHEYLYSISELKQMAEQQGFKVLSIKTCNFLAPFTAFINRRLANKLSDYEYKSGMRIGSIILIALQKP